MFLIYAVPIKYLVSQYCKVASYISGSFFVARTLTILKSRHQVNDTYYVFKIYRCMFDQKEMTPGGDS